MPTPSYLTLPWRHVLLTHLTSCWARLCRPRVHVTVTSPGRLYRAALHQDSQSTLLLSLRPGGRPSLSQATANTCLLVASVACVSLCCQQNPSKTPANPR